MSNRVGRNDPCPCGSGEKYKNCCQGRENRKQILSPGRIAIAAMGISVLAGLGYYGLPSSRRPPVTVPASFPLSASGARPSSQPTVYSEIPGVDLTTLTDAQRNRALRRANAENCPCGCGLTVAACRHLDRSCGTSLPMARAIVSEVLAGG